MENKEHQIVNRAIRNHIRFMTRMEKAFYSAIVLTAIVMSIAVVFLQQSLIMQSWRLMS